ncbi:SdpI/YhfL protein family protein [Belliella buryatensis]|uniref:SdpI/YhfL protein family protein n=1 Tax=Belliella buryatensis TaxID=1500549 RepID=A0A239G567_9BACT|nr:SdpI family protein [Belliella buryatensis]SNS63174.1 SdpI/YhfL protein family protein [Belliella buryatensis]
MNKFLVAILVLNIVITLIVILFYFVKPKTINPIVGYRTKLSMKNQANWDVSQNYFFKNWIFLLPIIYFSQVLMFVGEIPYKFIGYIVFSEFIVGTLALIFATEKKLKEN